MYWDILSNVILDLADLHVRCVLSTSRDSEVFLEQKITTEAKSLYESQSPAWIPERWVELNSVCSCLDEGEFGDLGLESLELIPHNLVFLSESVDSINHLLGKLILRVSQFVLV